MAHASFEKDSAKRSEHSDVDASSAERKLLELPFDITLADAELRWTFGMSREWPDLGTYFAYGTSED